MDTEREREITENGAAVKEVRYLPYDGHFRLLGRTLDIADILWLGFSASGLEFFTDASSVRIETEGLTDTGDPAQYAWLAVIVNDDDENARRIRIERGTHVYTILEDPERTKKKITILKLTESKNDKVGIAAVLADGWVRPSKEKDFRILYLGDSLTAGYGTEVLTDHGGFDDYVFRTDDVNVMKGYAFLTSRLLNADQMMICMSGSGVISKYVDPSSEIADTQDLIPELYPYTDKITEQIVRIILAARGNRKVAWNTRSSGTAGSFAIAEGISAFDPASYVPDIIVSNLGTNDASFTRGINSRERYFEQRYYELLRALAKDYPNAARLVVYGMVEKSLSPSAKGAAFLSGSDYLELPLMDPADGYGAGGHPSALTHRKAAELLADKIREMVL